jgi:branched-chain amino acid transport system ATP-binding protein
MLRVQGIDTFYGETQVLFGVSFEVGAGEIVALLGPSGAGKTTSLRSILGLTPARQGTVTFGGRDITRLPTHEIARAGVGWVPDDRRVFPTLTAARNLAIARKKTPFRGYDEDECCEIFPALKQNMSGGELQMVSISRALVGAPGLVLFDEPSQGLAPKVVQDVMRTVVRLKATGVACLVVDQNVRTVLEIADRVVVLHAGRVVHEGTGAALREDAAARINLGLAA